MHIQLKVKLVNSNDKYMPERKLDSAGIDLKARVDKDEHPVGLQLVRGKVTRVPLGIHTEFPREYAMRMIGRSGMALEGVHLLGGLIDADFRGEWTALLCNLGDQNHVIQDGDRVAQYVVLQLHECSLHEVTELSQTKRGDGGHGSTGK